MIVFYRPVCAIVTNYQEGQVDMLKKLALLILITLFVVPALSAEDEFDFDEFTGSFEALGDGLVRTLPHYNSIGLQWSDAYIGQLIGITPNFGVGATLGAVTIPGSVFEEFLEPYGQEVPEELERFGLPLPGYTIEGRLGGLIFPFDAGLKVGAADLDFEVGDTDLNLNYLLVGGDVRYAIFEGGLVMPKVHVGAGVNHSRVDLGVPGVLGENVELGTITTPDDTYLIELEDPSLGLGWESTSIDLKAQASKRFLIVEPYIGAAASYGRSDFTGSVSSDLLVDGQPADNQLTEDERERLDEELEKQGIDDVTSIGFSSDADGWSARGFAGAGLRILLFTLDVGASIDTNGSLGGQIHARFQM